jgi:hypothetical protein
MHKLFFSTGKLHYYIQKDIIFLQKTATNGSYRMARVVLFVAHWCLEKTVIIQCKKHADSPSYNSQP